MKGTVLGIIISGLAMRGIKALCDYLDYRYELKHGTDEDIEAHIADKAETRFREERKEKRYWQHRRDQAIRRYKERTGGIKPRQF